MFAKEIDDAIMASLDKYRKDPKYEKLCEKLCLTHEYDNYVLSLNSYMFFDETFFANGADGKFMAIQVDYSVKSVLDAFKEICEGSHD